jgi:CheY-like chemotaxis protein
MTTQAVTHPVRILVVDDEPAVAESIAMLLQFDGHHVKRAGSGEEAMACLASESFDLVMTDFEMKGMNGATLATQVRERWTNMPILMITAYAEMLPTWGVDLTHVNKVLSKPPFLNDLRLALRELLGPTEPAATPV